MGCLKVKGALCRLCGADTLIGRAADGSELELDCAARVYHQEVDPDAEPGDRIFWCLDTRESARVLHVSVCGGRRKA